MNKQRRKEIMEIITELENIKSKLESVKSDEEFAFENMPENLQVSMRGEESEEAIDYMDSAIGSLDEAIDNLNDIG